MMVGGYERQEVREELEEELKVAPDSAGVPYVRVGNGCGLLGISRAIQRTAEPPETVAGPVGSAEARR